MKSQINVIVAIDLTESRHREFVALLTQTFDAVAHYESLAGVGKLAVSDKRVLYIGLYADWKRNPALWPIADGTAQFLGLIAQPVPTSQEVQGGLDVGISFIIDNATDPASQIEAFADLLG